MKGFTLVEMIVTLGILTAISLILLAYGHISENQLILFRDQAKIINTLLRAKSLAVQEFQALDKGCYFGAHFDQGGDYIIFKHYGDNCDPSAFSEFGFSDPAVSVRDEEIIRNKLDSKISFGPLDFDDVLFIPPEPAVRIIPDSSSATRYITIKVTGNDNSSAKISINKAGQISTAK